MRKRQILFAFALCAGATAATAAPPDLRLSVDPAVKGRQIAEESDRRNLGFGDTQATMKMILESPQHELSVRELRYRANS